MKHNCLIGFCSSWVLREFIAENKIEIRIMENKWIPITDKPKVNADGCSEQVLLRYNYGLPKYIHVLGYYSLNTDKWYSSDGADYPYTHYQYIVD